MTIKKLGKSNISAEIVADSRSSVDGTRITTFVIEYPRIILAELNKHRIFSSNSSSSRAIPISRVIQQIQESCAMPVAWGANQAGMQAEKECTNPVVLEDLELVDLPSDDYWYESVAGSYTAEEAWKRASKEAITIAQAFSDAGYHKQIANRLLEPFQMMRTIVTSTDYENFFQLRYHKDADPTIYELARCMKEAYEESELSGEIQTLRAGQWHTPFVGHWWDDDGDIMYGLRVEKDHFHYPILWLTLEEALKVSSSCCAQVSFRKLDTSLEKALSIYDKLVNSKPVHASALEHCATPICRQGTSGVWDMLGIEGVTHMDKEGEFYSGNFKSFIQYRQLIKDNVYKGE